METKIISRNPAFTNAKKFMRNYISFANNILRTVDVNNIVLKISHFKILCFKISLTLNIVLQTIAIIKSRFP